VRPLLFRARLIACTLSATILVSGPAAAASAVGMWYGEGQPHEPNIIYIDEFKEDGTFRSEFRIYDRCEISWRQAEEGRWTQDGDTIITIIERVNGYPLAGYQEYTVEGLEENVIRLRHGETNYLFIERRIDRFEFPACFIGS